MEGSLWYPYCPSGRRPAVEAMVPVTASAVPWVGTPKSSIKVVKFLRKYPFKFTLRFTYNFSKVAFRQRTGRSWRQWPGSCTTRVQPQDPLPLPLWAWQMPEAPLPETDPLPFAWREAECCPEKTDLKCIFCPECEVFLLFFPQALWWRKEEHN